MQKPRYSVSGNIIKGAGYGQKLGFPTANLDRREYVRKRIRIPFGVYAGTATIIGTRRVYRAGIVIGPADKKGLPKIEAHLLDFSGALYGERVSLFLIRYLRPYREFKSADLLKRQIAQDLKKVRPIAKS